MLDATRLRVFREVARRGSISAAADALSFTQPAVCRQIATLEREAGAQLLERLPRGIRLTEAGRVLLGHAEAILDRMTAARTQVEAVTRLEAGACASAPFATANATIVPRAIAAFTREHPDVELSLAEATSRDLIPRLRAGELDVALATDRIDEELDELAAFEIAEDPMLVALPVGPPARPQARAAPARPARRRLDRGRPARLPAPAVRAPARPPASSRSSASAPSSGWASRGSSPPASASP